MSGKRIVSFGVAGLISVLAGCSSDTTASADQDLVTEDLEVISEEEAAEEAAASIDATNADAEFERLKAEIEGDR